MANAMDRKKMLRIKAATEELGLDKFKVFSIKELEAIAKAANADMISVMTYLRYRSV